MSQAITLFLAPGEASRWLHPLHGPGRGALDRMPPPGRFPVRVVVPGDVVYVGVVTLPGRNHRRNLQALPYALEDRLVQDVDSYHFALGRSLGNGRQLAGAVERVAMAQWLAQLRESDIEAQQMIPATLSIPAPAGADEAVVVVVADQALVRIGDDRAYQVAVDDLDTMLGLEPDLKQVHCADPEQRWTSTLSCARESMDQAESVEQLLAANAGLAPLNLLQGTYASRSESGTQVGILWRRVALLALAVLALAVGNRYLEYRASVQRLAALEQGVAQIVAQALGETPQGFAPLAARPLLEARLRALRGSGATSMDGLLFLLEAVGPKLTEGAGVRIDSLVYRSDGLILELRADGLDAIEKLRQRIGQETGVAVALESASTMADGTGARLRIGGAAR